MNTDLLIDEIVAALARNAREEHVIQELLQTLVNVALAEQNAIDEGLLAQIRRGNFKKLLEQVR